MMILHWKHGLKGRREMLMLVSYVGKYMMMVHCKHALKEREKEKQKKREGERC